MKRLFFTLILIALTLTSCLGQRAGQQQAIQQEPVAEITFTFTRQSGNASNQFAVWVEDIDGRHIKTLYATRWTANGGWSRRPTSIPVWVRQSSLDGMNRAQIDIISGATPRGTATLNYLWDGTDEQGNSVPVGNYVMFLEGTLRWENQVLYRAPFTFGQGVITAVVSYEYTGDSAAERSMITNVNVRSLR
jgi:hypothetical protein